jgi:transposase
MPVNGRSRGGLISEIHAVVDTNGFLSVWDLQRAGARDNRLVFKLLSRLNSGSMLLADRGYDANWLRAFAAKKGPTFRQMQSQRAHLLQPALYRARNLVKRFFNKIKQCRRVATRYERLAAKYLAFIQLGSIRPWLRTNDYTALATHRVRRADTFTARS